MRGVAAVRVPVGSRSERSFPRAFGPRAEVAEHESAVLKDNPLGDPTRRGIAVLRPPSGRTEGLPLLVLLPGYAGAGPSELTRQNPFDETLFRLFDHLVRTGACGEATLVSPDCTTALGGSQYVDSTAMGRYDAYVVDEVLPWAEERFRPRGVGVLGQSSGGFGALHLAFEHPGRFDAVGSSAGDLGFEYAYLPELGRACREYQRHGGPEAFLATLFRDPSTFQGPSSGSGAALIVSGVAASYSPVDGIPGAFELPVDWETGELRPEIWARWKSFDPVARVARDDEAAALRRLKLLHVTASTGDEWSLDQGARWFAATARRHGVELLHEEFPGGHFVRGPRFASLFAHLTAALRGAD